MEIFNKMISNFLHLFVRKSTSTHSDILQKDTQVYDAKLRSDALKESSLMSNDFFSISAPNTLNPVSEIVDTQQDRLKRSFKSQVKQLRAMALVPHDPSCPDIFECKKSPCVKNEPFKISPSRKKSKALKVDAEKIRKRVLEELKPITQDDLGDMKEFMQKDEAE